MSDADTGTRDASYYLAVLRFRKWQVILVTLLVTLGVAFWTFRQPKTYFAQATVQVYAQPNLFAPTLPVNQLQVNMDTERVIAGSSAVADAVNQARGVTIPLETYLKHLSRTADPSNNILLIGYSSSAPNGAPRIAAATANAFADAYVAHRSGLYQAKATALENAIEVASTKASGELTDLSTNFDKATSDRDRASLQAQINAKTAQIFELEQQKYQVVAIEKSPGAEVLIYATPPSHPASPKPVRNISLAILGGLLLGVGVAFGLESIDNRVKSREEFEQRLGAPVLAVVPRVRTWRKNTEAHLITLEDPRGAVSEAYRTLGTNVRYAARKGIKVITITSSMSGEGKTTTAANLAVVLAQSGRRVILVSADLRRPRIHEFFHLPNGPGLSDALGGTAGPMDLKDLIVDPGIAGMRLRLLNSGTPAADPVALLADARAQEVFKTMRDISDFVLIDAPPILAVADASILAELSDATIFVMDGHVSGREALAESREQLKSAGAVDARLLGGVYNTVDERSGAGYYRYYRYDRYYGSYYGENAKGGASSNGASNGTSKRAKAHAAKR